MWGRRTSQFRPRTGNAATTTRREQLGIPKTLPALCDVAALPASPARVGLHLLDLHLHPPGSQQLPLLNRTCGGDTGSGRLSCLRFSYRLMSHGRLKKSVWIWCSEVIKLCRPTRASPQSILLQYGTFFCCFETYFSPPSRCLTERKYAVRFRIRERSIQLTHGRSYAQWPPRPACDFVLLSGTMGCGSFEWLFDQDHVTC